MAYDYKDEFKSWPTTLVSLPLETYLQVFLVHLLIVQELLSGFLQVPREAFFTALEKKVLQERHMRQVDPYSLRDMKLSLIFQLVNQLDMENTDWKITSGTTILTCNMRLIHLHKHHIHQTLAPGHCPSHS